MDQARKAGVTNDSIQRAIAHATAKDSAELEELALEIIGPESMAIIATVVTDNRNRSISEIRKIAENHNARLADENSLRWMFDRVGLLILHNTEERAISDELQLKLIDAGGEDIILEEKEILILTNPKIYIALG